MLKLDSSFRHYQYFLNIVDLPEWSYKNDLGKSMNIEAYKLTLPYVKRDNTR